MFLSTTASATMFADKTAFLVNQRLVATVRTFLPLRLCTVHNILFQGTTHADLPRIDVFAFQLQRIDKFYHILNRHAIAQHARNELGIVPILLIKLLTQSLYGHLIATFVLELEVIALRTVGQLTLHDASLRYGLWQYNALFVIL